MKSSTPYSSFSSARFKTTPSQRAMPRLSAAKSWSFTKRPSRRNQARRGPQSIRAKRGSPSKGTISGAQAPDMIIH